MQIAILGGGVGGLTAAHELVHRGHQVHVYEKGSLLGGKARSMGKPGSASGGRQPLPGEHGFRFFPGFYKHVVDTMQRIPVPGGNAAGNLVETTAGAFAQEGKPLFQFPTVPRAGGQSDWLRLLVERFTLPQLGLTYDDGLFFAAKLARFAVSCDSRRLEQYEFTSWWDFLEADSRSAQFQKVLAEGMTRSLVAMKARSASTRTIGKILLQMVFTLTLEGRGMDRVLNAPTSDAWIDPWVAHLQGTGLCTFHKDIEVDSFGFNGTGITQVNLRAAGGATQAVTADAYISALPVEVMAQVLAKTPAIAAAAPSLAHLKDLHVEWMNGIQFYLTTDIPYVHGHMIAVDSPWALTLLSQAQFWGGVNLGNHGDGTVKGILSVDISDWKTAGKFVQQKPAEQCANETEVAQECWAQLVPHFSATATPLPAQPHSWFLDPSIVFGATPRGVITIASLLQKLKGAPGSGSGSGSSRPAKPPRAENMEPLLINTTGSLRHRPNAGTEIPNLFLASDYVATYTDLACMEGANEAGRRAVNAFLDSTNSSYPRCMVQDLVEPAFLDPLKQWDEFLYANNFGPPSLMPAIP